MPNVKISVVLPVYNSENFLDETIQSILNQTFEDFELIIINDGSTDKSFLIMENYKKKDKRIKIIDNKKNQGFPTSLNIGLNEAKGKYIAICNSDDLSHPKRFEIQFDYLEKRPHIFLVGTSAIVINQEGKEINKLRKYDDYKVLGWRLRKSCGIVHPSIMFRNEGILFDKHFGGATDYHFYYQILKKGKNVTNLPYFLVKYRIHPGSMSIYNRKEQEKLRDEVLEKFSKMKNNVGFFKKGVYSIKLLFYKKILEKWQ